MMFSQAERSIFKFPSPDGQLTLHDDPLRIRRELLLASKGKFNDLLAKLTSKEQLETLSPEQKADALYQNALIEKEILECGRIAFDCAPIDFQTGSGFTDAYISELLNLYIEFMNEKKVNTESTATSQ